jgi:saccharopine dehydrogenase (NAD+, L-lysine forming)
MSFGDKYLMHLLALVNVGMTSVKPIMYEGKAIVPLQFLKAVLPDPASLGPRTKGKTNIGCIITGTKDGKPKTYYVNNIMDHEQAFKETGAQAIAYTTGVPAMIAAALILTQQWTGAGVFNVEQMNPDPYMAMLNQWGLPWKEHHNPILMDTL